jgi:predicted TIM-barrel fold metal-dependent hydrolase
MVTQPTLDIVDIHTHLWPPAWGPGGARRKPGATLAADILNRIANPDALVGEFEAAGVGLAVVSTTIESLFGIEGPVDGAVIAEVNDWLATLVAKHPGRLAALATADAFAGEAGAREAERAVVELGLCGIVIDSSRRGLFLGDASVRPTLEVAARLRVPVFVHPVGLPDPSIFIAGAGTLGNSLGRGLMNGVAFLSVLQSGILDELPELDLVFATLGLGGIVQAARGGKFGREQRGRSPRPNIYFDTMGDDPAIIKVLTSFFGADRVVAGTDWPILPALSQQTLKANLEAAGLSEAEQKLVAGGNARRLFERRAARSEAAE